MAAEAPEANDPPDREVSTASGAGDAPPGRQTCMNCGEPLHGRWCAACGQDSTRTLRSVSQLLRQALQEIFEVDGRLNRTLRALLVHPGRLTREYAEGAFVAQTSPIRLYLSASALYFLVVPALGVGFLQLDPAAPGPGYLEIGPLGWNSRLLFFLLAPATAVALGVLLWDRRPPFEVLFVFGVHYNVAYLALMAILAGAVAVGVAVGLPDLFVLLLALGVLAPLPYLARALRVAFQLPPLRRAVTTVLLFLLHLACGQALNNLLSSFTSASGGSS